MSPPTTKFISATPASTRRWFSSCKVFAALFIVVFTSTLPAQAQQAGKIARIAYLDPGNASSSAGLVDAFRQELSKLGWSEGKNITIEYRFLEQNLERARESVADLLHLKVDLIVVAGTAPTAAAKRATDTVPIVMANVGDPVGAGLVASLARPGGNVTGLSNLSPDLNTKRLEILKDVVPKLAQVGLLTLPGANIAADLQLKQLRAAAPALKIKLEEIETQADTKSLANAFQIAKQKHVRAILTTASPRFTAARKQIVELAGKSALPAIYFQREFVNDGGLMSYGVDYEDMFRGAAVYVDKILKGAKPADLPVEQPKKFEFIVNLKAAKQIGLTIPPNVLVRADRVIR